MLTYPKPRPFRVSVQRKMEKRDDDSGRNPRGGQHGHLAWWRNERKALFANFSSSYRIFRHTDADLVSIVWENADLEKMKALLDSSEGKAAEAAHTVIDPIEIFIEVEGGK